VSADETPLSESAGDSPAGVPAPRVGFVRRWVRRLTGFVGVCAILTGLFILSPLPNRIYAAMDGQDELRKADVIICLGGEPGRVIEAARLLQDGYAPTMIVTNFGPAAHQMRSQAIEWGAPPDRVLVEATSRRTADHPAAVAKAGGIDIANDTCIIVTSYTHLLRARAVFEKAGYRRIVMREPRWERQSRDAAGMSWRSRVLVFPQMLYEGTGWLLYRVSGDI